MSFVTAANCGNEHNEWLSAIDFYEKDLDILENRLAEVAGKNTSHDAMAGVEHFQNQFIVQRNNIDEIRHNIHEHIQHVADDSKEHAGKINTIYTHEHERMRDVFINFEKVVKDLRQEFNQYLSRWM